MMTGGERDVLSEMRLFTKCFLALRCLNELQALGSI